MNEGSNEDDAHSFICLCSLLSCVFSLFRWSDQRKSQLVVVVLIAAFIFLLSQYTDDDDAHIFIFSALSMKINLVHLIMSAACRVRCSFAFSLFFSLFRRVCCPSSVIPFRVLLLLGGTARWSKKLLATLKRKLPRSKSAPAPSDEVENFLQRTPTVATLNPLKFQLAPGMRRN